MSGKVNAFKTYVEDAYDAAANAFRVDPSANNWLDLKVAMWAWQHVHQMPDSRLSDAAHKHLMYIAEHAKGDRDFSEPT